MICIPDMPPALGTGTTIRLAPDQLAALANEIARQLAGLTGNGRNAELQTETTAAQPHLLDRFELAGALGVSVSSIDRWTKGGDIPAIKGRRRVRYDLAEVRRALATGAGRSRQPD